MKNFFISLLFCSVSAHLLSQGTQFNFAYGNDGIDRGNNVVEGPGGNFYIVGSTSSSSTGNTDILVLCIDENGAVLWTNSYGTAQTDIGIDIIYTANNELLVLGQSNGIGQGGYDIFLTKLTLDGAIIWEKTYGGDDWEFAWDMQDDTLGNFYIVGETYSFGEGNNDAYLLLVNSEGDVLIEKTFGTDGNELFRKMDITNDGDVVLIGDQKLSGNSFSNAWLMKVNAIGDEIWEFTRDLGEGYDEFGQDLVLIDNQIIAMSNFPDSPNAPYCSYWRMDESNAFLWERTIANQILYGILKKNEISFVMTGETLDYNAFWFHMKQNDGWEVNAGGGPAEFDYDNGNGKDKFVNSLNTIDGGFICVGETEVTVEGLTSVLVIKFDSLLTSQQEIDLANLPLAIVSVQQTASFSVYPNPSKDHIFIQSDNLNNKITFELRNSTGSLVKKGLLLDSVINIDDLKPSIYFLTLFEDKVAIGTRKVSVK